METVKGHVGAPTGSVVPRAMPSNWNWSWSKPSPSFETRISYDVHLRSSAGCMVNGQLFAYRKQNSPAIDAGDPASDYSLEPVIPGVGGHGHRVNLGAYGNTPEAAMSKIRGTMLIMR